MLTLLQRLQFILQTDTNQNQVSPQLYGNCSDSLTCIAIHDIIQQNSPLFISIRHQERSPLASITQLFTADAGMGVNLWRRVSVG